MHKKNNEIHWPSIDPATIPTLKTRKLVLWEETVRRCLEENAYLPFFGIQIEPDDSLIGIYLKQIIESRRPMELGVHCPRCGRMLSISHCGYLNHIYAFLKARCCDATLYVLFCFRRPRTHPAALLDPEAERLFVMPGESWLEDGTDWVLWQAMHDLGKRVRAEKGRSEAEFIQNDSPHIIGRGTANPGHMMFQDIVGVFDLLAQQKNRGRPVSILCTAEAEWIFPLVEAMFPKEDVVRTKRCFNELALSMDNAKVSPNIPDVRMAWPDSRNISSALTTLTDTFLRLGNQGTSCFDSGTVIMIHARFGPRSWEPTVSNLLKFIQQMNNQIRESRFVVHAVTDSRNPELLEFSEAVSDMENVAVLLNPTIVNLSANILRSSVSVGVIGTGFWWPSLGDVPSVTLHPDGDTSNIVIYEWIACPVNGEKPLYCRMLSADRWIGITEHRDMPRNPFDAIHIPVREVVMETVRLLHATGILR